MIEFFPLGQGKQREKILKLRDALDKRLEERKRNAISVRKCRGKAKKLRLEAEVRSVVIHGRITLEVEYPEFLDDSSNP